MTDVDSRDWRATIAEARSRGHVYLDFLTAIDRGEALEVVAHVLNPGTGDHVLFSTMLAPAAGAGLEIDSLAALYRSADWHEREAAEMFGVRFAGHPDPRPLLLRASSAVPPLRKSFALVERVETPWPGAADPAGGAARTRRRQLAPGVREEWQESQP